jgi:hypothetical protein
VMFPFKKRVKQQGLHVVHFLLLCHTDRMDRRRCRRSSSCICCTAQYMLPVMYRL